MSKPIYKLCLIHGFKEAYYQLSEAEKKAFWEEFGKANLPGVEMVGPYYDAQWSNDRYMTFFMMKYPSIEMALADTHNAQRVQLFRYLDSETIMGVEAEDMNLIFGFYPEREATGTV